jgi:formate dehydrogenase iron-sulfur subunit
MADMKNLSGVNLFGRRMGLLVSPELCTGCRGCQSACKEWNKLPAEPTVNSGTYENPPDLSAVTYNRIRFVEMNSKTKGVEWIFSSQRCMHCRKAGCIDVCPAPDALYRTKQGAVGFNQKECVSCGFCRTACPFDIPRYDANGKISKCHMCEDRIAYGMAPLCAKTCPTGAIKYGERDKLIAEAKAEGYSNVYGERELRGLGVVFAFSKKPEDYKYDAAPDIPLSVSFWTSLLKPLTVAGVSVAVAGSALHYLTVGPKDDEEGGDQ